MFSYLFKNLSILKKFLLINLIIFIIIGSFTLVYLSKVQPNLIKKKASNHIQIIDNTVDHIKRLEIKFNNEDVRKFLFSTRFLFQNLERVVLYDENFELVGDTDTLDLDPRSFSQRLDPIEFESIENKIPEKKIKENSNENKDNFISDNLIEYSNSKDFGKPFTFTQENYRQFLLITIKNVNISGENVGYLAISENANDIKAVINERKSLIIRSAFFVAVVILIFSFVLNRYFLKPIRNLVDYTKKIKEKSKKQTNIKSLKQRKDELGTLSQSLDEMTSELQRRINNAENFSTDLVHEIRNPLASLKSASEILGEANSENEREKLLKILSHDVERIERLITDYSQMHKDEAAITKEQMKKIDLKEIVQSVVDDFNAIFYPKRGIKIDLYLENQGSRYEIFGIENRIEQVLANLLENSISFSEDNKKILVKIIKDKDKKIILSVIDQGIGFKESDTSKIFNRFYSNRPDKFGEHSGLGLNIVKNLVDLHGGIISASNNHPEKGAKVEVIFPSIN